MTLEPNGEVDISDGSDMSDLGPMPILWNLVEISDEVKYIQQTRVFWKLKDLEFFNTLTFSSTVSFYPLLIVQRSYDSNIMWNNLMSWVLQFFFLFQEIYNLIFDASCFQTLLKFIRSLIIYHYSSKTRTGPRCTSRKPEQVQDVLQGQSYLPHGRRKLCISRHHVSTKTARRPRSNISET
jgi:hypothetical protein